MTSLREYPWKIVEIDMFEQDGKCYIRVVDYYRYPEVTKFTYTRSNSTITAFKVALECHGIPEVMIANSKLSWNFQSWLVPTVSNMSPVICTLKQLRNGKNSQEPPKATCMPFSDNTPY